MKLLVALLACLPAEGVAQTLSPPLSSAESYTITSWFGPRIRPQTTTPPTFEVHNGVDYSPQDGFGTPSLAEEAGTIETITKDPKRGGFYIKYTGSGANEWEHLHIFTSSASYPITLANGWRLLQESDGSLAIYRPQPLIQNGISYPATVLSNEAAVGQTTVVQGEPIAPVGNSGAGTGAHLHLILLTRGNKTDPLLDVIHPKGPPALTFISPQDGQIIGYGSDSFSNFPFVVNVNAAATSAGKDIDSVDFTLDGAPLLIGGAGTHTFQFGFPGTGMDYACDDSFTTQQTPCPSPTTSGVQPILHQPFQPYFDLLYDLTQETAGQHELCVVTTNVNGDVTGSACQSFGPSDWICAVEKAVVAVRQSAVAEFVKLSAFSRRSPDGATTADAVQDAGSVRGANQRQAIAGDLPADGRLTAYAAEGAGSVWGANQRAFLGSERPSGHVLQRLGKGSSLALACARGVPLEDRGVNDGTGDGGAYYNA